MVDESMFLASEEAWLMHKKGRFMQFFSHQRTNVMRRSTREIGGEIEYIVFYFDIIFVLV
ncbi:hypothetical protein Q5O89_01120 [Peribacillus frigoritolerans]|nr:hypothetical protein [Peribacillus frigoritolerans]